MIETVRNAILRNSVAASVVSSLEGLLLRHSRSKHTEDLEPAKLIWQRDRDLPSVDRHTRVQDNAPLTFEASIARSKTLTSADVVDAPELIGGFQVEIYPER
jgi:hypothetical protein